MSILSIIIFILSGVLSEGCGQNETFTVMSDKFENAQGCYVPSYRFRSSHNFMYISYPTGGRQQANYLGVDTSSPEDDGKYVLSFYGDDGHLISCKTTMYSVMESPVEIKWWDTCFGDNDISITCGCGTETDSQEYTGDGEEQGNYVVQEPTEYPIGMIIFYGYVVIGIIASVVYTRCIQGVVIRGRN